MRGAGVIAAAALGWLAAGPAPAAEVPPLPKVAWSFNGPFGTVDIASAQRGFQVYSEVCSTCHSMVHLHYRDLSGIGLSPEQIKAVAAAVQVPSGLNDEGVPVEGPGTPASQFRSPYPNEKAARAALGGALPPDLSVIVKARDGGVDYVHALLNGYSDTPPEGVKIGAGQYYNEYFPGNAIGMPQPLHDDQVTYSDGTKATIEQMSKDVVNFLTWTANPEMTQRKRLGIQVGLFLLLMCGLTYAVKRQVWADVH